MNTLFPIFVKLDKIHTLVVGGGNVGLEKLEALLVNSPEANVTLVSPTIREEIIELSHHHQGLKLIFRGFEWQDLDQKDMVICASDQKEMHKEIYLECKKRHLLINVADTPPICDFYLGSIVRKGDLKIAISTNGKSPTFAKRLKETLNETLSDDIQQALDNLQAVRNKMSGDFAEKLKKLNELTKTLSD